MTSTTRKWAVILGGSTLAVLTLSASPAAAHETTELVPVRWVRELVPQWRFASDFPADSAFRARVADGADVWNAQSAPHGWTQASGTATADDYPYTCTTDVNNSLAGTVSVQWDPYLDDFNNNPDNVGIGIYCGIGGGEEILHAYVGFDPEANWYTGTGSPGETQADVWSVAAHEWGHVLGHQHFGDSESICNLNDLGTYHTMCPAHPTGSTGQRTLGPHEIHDYETAYNRMHWYLNYSWGNSTVDDDFSFGYEDSQLVVGDWDGNGTDEPGFRLGNTWWLNAGHDAVYETITSFGAQTGDIPVAGNWTLDGSQASLLGVFRSSNNTWYLDDGTATPEICQWASTHVKLSADMDSDYPDELVAVGGTGGNTWYRNFECDGDTDDSFQWGQSGDTKLMGNIQYETSGKEYDEPVVVRGKVWYHNFNYDSDTDWPTSGTYTFGNADDIKFVGDWDTNDDKDEPAVVRPN